MARFIVIHNVAPEEISQDQLVDLGKQVAARLKPGVEWLNSWYASGPDKLYCEWEAPDAEAIRKSLAHVEHIMSTDEIHPVVLIDPSLFK